MAEAQYKSHLSHNSSWVHWWQDEFLIAMIYQHLLHSNLNLREKLGRISEVTFMSSVSLLFQKYVTLIYVEMYITTDVF